MAESTHSPEVAASHEVTGVAAQLLILDFGSQYGKLIDRRVREHGVKCDVAPADAPTELLEQYDAFILSGGPASVTDADAPAHNPDLFELGKPVLGTCYGHQLIAHHYGGKIGKHERREDGKTQITVEEDGALFSGLEPQQTVVMSHGDSVLEVPEGFQVTARSGDIVAAMQNPGKKLYTTQFHPEVTHTENGRDMLANFLFGVAGLEKNYQVENKLNEALNYVKRVAGSHDIACFVSGGLDSSVTAALLKAADLPGKLRFVLVDNGMLREGEVEQIVSTYRRMAIEVEVRNEADRFYTAQTKLRSGEQSQPLNRATDPQEIRQIIGDTFIAVREDYLAEIGWNPNNTMLAMGTLRTDLIESGSAIASVNADESGIKIHHNDTDDVRRLRELGLVLEPLAELHKDEVRAVGVELNLPEEILYRQPSPGPSGGVRIMTQTSPYRHEEIDRIDEQLDAYRTAGLGAAVLQMPTVGVQGDRRTYAHMVALSTNGLPKNWQDLAEVGNEIPRSIFGVNRVVHASGDIVNGIVPGVTNTLLDKEGIPLWRTVDHVARKVLAKYGMNHTSIVSQVPVILTGLNYGIPGDRAVGFRPFKTEDYMTGEAAVPAIDFPLEAYVEIVAQVTAIRGIGRLLIDLSGKPPGTTEWR